MKLENMNVTSNAESSSIAPDVNLMSDEFNFSPISEEARESGDGDSGAESRETSEFTNNNYDKTRTKNVHDESADSKRPKDKRASKIPVRQVKLPSASKIQYQPKGRADEETGVIDRADVNKSSDADDNLDNASWDLGKAGEVSTSNRCDADGIQTTGLGSEEDAVPILEAPEEFRYADKRGPEERHRDSLQRDRDNACTPETGDTSRRAARENAGGHGSAAHDASDGDGPSDTPQAGMRSASGGDEDGSPCADRAETTAGPSIEIGAAECARASGCSRVSTATVCVALDPDPICAHFQDTKPHSGASTPTKHLSWRFENGRLVFDDDVRSDDDDDDENAVLYSKDLNRRVDDSRSRLRHLEEKLKQAGITDDDDPKIAKPVEQVVDKSRQDTNHNIVPQESGTLCEFDASRVAAFPALDGYWEVYDELSDSDSDCEQHHCIIPKPRDGTSKMGIDGERSKHNPDRDNLKSLLKRPGKNRDKRSNRVVFNENKNEFFDADYIILIREECDYDDEDDDGVCTCNQHEMVRLTCCEPNCNCTAYDGFEQTPQSPKFAPPLEFVDAVTLSPPEGYKDMELEEQQLLALQHIARRGTQRTAVCRECSVTHEDDDGDGSLSDNETCGETNPVLDELEEKEKTDQSQQTTPTTPPNDSETITMTTVTEQRILREVDDEKKSAGGSPINGILKGGRLWKQQSIEASATAKPPEPQQVVETSDEEGSNRRSVRFIESEQNKRANCDGANDGASEANKPENINEQKQNDNNISTNSISPESTEMMLTFKLGNHVLISNNSLKPNSAVRQLFPCTKQLNGKSEDESIHQYLVTAESLRAFEEAKRSKLPQIIQSGETDDSIKRAIERNTLRRSLIRYEPRSKKNVQKTDNSLVERIKQLTCDVDDQPDIPPRASPPGEEARNSPDTNQTVCKNSDKSFSPSSSSTASSNSSSVSSTYKKITDLFGKRDKMGEETKAMSSLPDLGNGGSHIHEIAESKASVTESRKQFLAPLTACVSGLGNGDEYYYHMNNHVGERASMASSVGTEYSLEDIDEGLRNGEDDCKKIAPDVIAGTPNASESGDELAIFVQQDAGRIERIKKKYQPDANKEEEDDEHDDYGFNRRPSVRGIKPRFGSTTEILQQIQNQLQPPAPTARVAWPYYSESGLTGVDNSKPRNVNQNPNYQYPNVPEEVKTRNVQYRPTSLQDENPYQNCSNQRCVRDVYRANGNQAYSSVMKVGNCTEYYQVSRTRNGRPQSPPPLDMSKTYHQTMVYIPYNHIEGYHQQTPYYQTSDYVRVSNQNQINKRYIEPIYQQRIHAEEHHYVPLKPVVRIPLMTRSESPVPGQFSTARSTQTPLPAASTCNFYPGNPRFRPIVGPVWPPNDCNYVPKSNRHSFPAAIPRYPPADSISLTDSDSQHSGQIPNGFQIKDSLPNSPTKNRFLERGVPEGAAASGPPQDAQSSSSTMTSPTSPQNPPAQHAAQKSLFYAMNV